MSLFPSVQGTDNQEKCGEKSGKPADSAWLNLSSFKNESTVPAISGPKYSLCEPEFHDKLEISSHHDSRAKSSSRQSNPTDELAIQDDSKEIPRSPNVNLDSSIKSKSRVKYEDHHKSKKRKKDAHKKTKHKSKSPKRDKVHHKPSLPIPSRVVFLEQVKDLGYEDTYRMDKKPDKDNYTFSAPNRKHLSKYRYLSKIPYGITKSQFLDGKPKKSHERYYNSKRAADIYGAGAKIESNPEMDLKTPLSYFIYLPPSVEAPDTKLADPMGVYDSSTQLWAQGKAPAHQSNEQTTPSSYLNSAVAQEIASCNKQLRENPSDISLWLKLIDLQDGLLQQRTDDDSSKLFSESIIHDKKLAVIKQALEKNPSDLQLLLKQLDMNSKTMDWEELSSQWKTLTFTHINDIDVWRSYLKHVKNNFSKFTVSLMTKAYAKCIKALRRVNEGLLKSHPPKPDSEQSVLEIMLELCDVLHMANCTEKAVAIIQANIEFNIYRPGGLTEHHDEAIEKFQEFYDSGYPRFGEPGAKGWSSFGSHSYSVLPAPLKPTAKQDEEEEERLISLCQGQQRSEAWLLFENNREMSHWMPWRPAADETDDNCEDPSRLVLSDDIIDFVFFVKDENLRLKLCFEALKWFGLRKASFFPTWQSLSGVNQLKRSFGDSCLSSEWGEYVLNGMFVAHCVEQLSQRLENPTELVTFQLKHQMEKVVNCTDKKQQKKLQKEFKSYAKAVLSLPENRSNQEVWLIYADCNSKLGLQTEMNAVYNGLIQSENLETQDRKLKLSHLQLYWAATQGELEQHLPSSDRLLSLVSWILLRKNVTEAVTPAQKLQLVQTAEQILEDSYEQVKINHESEDYVICLSYLIPCYIITLALVRGLADLKQSVNYWVPLMEELASENNVILENCYTRIVKVVNYIKSHLYQSSLPLLRSLLQKAIDSCPRNIEFLTLYIDIERAGYVVSRVRQLFTSTLTSLSLSSKNLRDKEVLAAFAVVFELEILGKNAANDDVVFLGLSNRIRSVCERSFSSLTPQSVLIWRLGLYHEAVYGDKLKLKSLFYAAIQSCPYAKCLYLDMIKYMPDMIEEILDVAEEKEVRIHTPLDELDILLHQES